MKHFIAFLSICLFQYSGIAQTTTYLWSNGATTSTINVNPSVTTTYYVTITQDAVEYYDSLVVNIEPNQNTPTFTQMGPYLSGATIPALPTTSNNGITGTWSPAINNTTTTTYTFTPTVGQCATTNTMIVTINDPLNYSLSSNANNNTICAGTTVTLSVNIPGASSVTDIDGNTYPTVQIGTQLWMKENLRTTKYSDGTDIPLVTDNSEWASNYNSGTTLPMMSWYDNDQATYTANKFGVLYNGYSVNPTTNGNKNVCPISWHVPSDVEWTTLTDYLGGASVAGGKMKSIGTQYWQSPNLDATNESDFSSFPSGYRTRYGDFGTIGYVGYWWSPHENSTDNARANFLFSEHGYTSWSFIGEDYGFSVRCIKD